MTNTITDWLGLDLATVSQGTLFKYFFSNIQPDNIDDTFYLTNSDKGIELVISEEKLVTTIHLFSGEDGEYGPFNDDMPFNLSFSMSKEDLRKFFGNPERTGGGHNALYIGYVDPWEKFYLNPYTIHVVYKKGSIAKISLGLLSMESYFNIALQ